MTNYLDTFIQYLEKYPRAKIHLDNCPRKDLVLSYLSGFLSKAEEALALEHFSICPECLELLTEQVKKIPLLLSFKNKDKKLRKHASFAKAAGISQRIPSSIQIPESIINSKEDIAIKLESDPSKNTLKIFFLGGSFKTRAKVNLQVTFDDHRECFLGKSIARGGIWKIDLEKANRILELSIEFEEGVN